MIHGITCVEVGCAGLSRGGDGSSTQGSNVSKPGGCGEDGEGGCNGSVSGGAGAWLLFQALHQDSLKRLPSGPIRHGSELLADDWSVRAGRCWSCSRGFG